jgi:hypothetical protein
VAVVVLWELLSVAETQALAAWYPSMLEIRRPRVQQGVICSFRPALEQVEVAYKYSVGLALPAKAVVLQCRQVSVPLLAPLVENCRSLVVTALLVVAFTCRLGQVAALAVAVCL